MPMLHLVCRLLRQQQAAARIQAGARMHHHRQAFRTAKEAAIRLQAAWRAALARQHAQEMRAAREIQKHVRGFLVRAAWRCNRDACIKIQVEISAPRAHVSELDRLQHQRSGAPIVVGLDMCSSANALCRHTGECIASAGAFMPTNVLPSASKVMCGGATQSSPFARCG